jgi:class 3 adenylate cyclase
VEEFLTGVRHGPEPDRVLATVLFTDIVGSTQRAAELGDRKWRGLLEDHDALVRRELDRFRGREVNTVGDGFLATFDGPARAIRCAHAIAERVRALGLEMRSGLHTGEIELAGDDVRGIAVHIGARAAALAGPGEVFATSTVKDLVAGSGIEFDDRGEHVLKGVPGEWRIFLRDIRLTTSERGGAFERVATATAYRSRLCLLPGGTTKTQRGCPLHIYSHQSRSRSASARSRPGLISGRRRGRPSAGRSCAARVIRRTVSSTSSSCAIELGGLVGFVMSMGGVVTEP